MEQTRFYSSLVYSFIISPILKKISNIRERKRAKEEAEENELFKSKAVKLTFKLDDIVNRIEGTHKKIGKETFYSSKVYFTFDYNTVKIKANRTLAKQRIDLEMWFVLHKEIDVYITKMEYIKENFVEIDYIQEINYGDCAYFDGKHIYRYFFDFSFIE